MADLRLDGRGRVYRRAWRRRAAPFGVTAAVALGSVGALAWVAPRTRVPVNAHAPSSVGPEAAMRTASVAIHRLEASLAADEKQIAAMAAQPVPGVTGGPMAALPPLPPLPVLPPPPPVHATTGASGVVP